jgi:hypothetical protein
MKITVDPMPGLKLDKLRRVNENFNTKAMESLHRDQAHAQKRLWAQTNDPALAPEATMRGITVEELSAIILSKPNAGAERELQRQTIMKKIEQAQTPAELDAI